MTTDSKSYVSQTMERLCHDLLLSAQIASTVDNGDLHDVLSGWSGMAHSCREDVNRIESENAELREKLEKSENAWGACTMTAITRERDELREKLETVTIERDRACGLRNQYLCDCDDYYKKVQSLEAELARLKSSPEVQWAVTRPGLDRKAAEALARKLHNTYWAGYQAVPLHAPEDGPWVIECLDSCGKAYVHHITTKEPGKPDITGHRRVGAVSEATRYETCELTDAMRDLVGNYYPVRLADVERKGNDETET